MSGLPPLIGASKGDPEPKALLLARLTQGMEKIHALNADLTAHVNALRSLVVTQPEVRREVREVSFFQIALLNELALMKSELDAARMTGLVQSSKVTSKDLPLHPSQLAQRPLDDGLFASAKRYHDGEIYRPADGRWNASGDDTFREKEEGGLT